MLDVGEDISTLHFGEMALRAGGGKRFQAGLGCDVGSRFALRRLDVLKAGCHSLVDNGAGRGFFACFRQRETGFLRFQFQALAPGQIENVCFLRDRLADSRFALTPLQLITGPSFRQRTPLCCISSTAHAWKPHGL
jgi:hypothetical protein